MCDACACDRGSWSVIGRVTKNLLSQALPCFGRHVKPLVPAAFAVVSTHQPSWACVVGYGPFFLCVIQKEGLCPSSGGINRLMMMMMIMFIHTNVCTVRESNLRAPLSRQVSLPLLQITSLRKLMKSYLISQNLTS
jgi:hypothetical protein